MNRRQFEATVLIVLLVQAALTLPRLWAHKAFNTTPPGSLSHTAAEDVTLVIR